MVILSIISLIFAIVALGIAIVLFVMYNKKSKLFTQLIKSHNTNANVLDTLSKSISTTNDDVKKLAELLAKLSSLVQELSKIKKPISKAKTVTTPNKSTKQSD